MRFPNTKVKNVNRVKLAPSILSADIINIRKQIQQIEKAGADLIHLDIMDGHFVPNITFGPMFVKAIRPLTNLPLDTHLMIENPDDYLEAFKKAGSDHITVHIEVCPHLHRTVQKIKKLGMTCGVSLNPSTPAFMIKEILSEIDLVLVMTVNPGFGGQKFIRTMLPKIKEIASMIKEKNRHIYLQVDGGVDETNARELVQAGVNILVAGNYLFSGGNINKAIKTLRKICSKSHR